MANAVYALCGLTSLICALLLLRSYGRKRTRLLLWTSLCFLGLAMSNAFLILDFILIRDTDFSAWRILPAFVGTGILIYGLIEEAI